MERLRELRLKRGMTQTQVGDLIGVSCVTIGRYEAGEREPSNAKIAALADYFGVSVDYLMGRSEPSHPMEDAERERYLSKLTEYTPAQLKELTDLAARLWPEKTRKGKEDSK